MKRAVLLLFFVASCSLDYTKLRGPSDGAGGASTDGTGGRGAMGGGGSTAVDAFGEGPETSGSGGTPADSAQVDGSGNPDTGDAGPPNCVSNASCNCEFFGAHAYRFCKTNRQFADAEADCVAEGMRLVRLDSNAENNWVFQTKQAEGLPTT